MLMFATSSINIKNDSEKGKRRLHENFRKVEEEIAECEEGCRKESEENANNGIRLIMLTNISFF